MDTRVSVISIIVKEEEAEFDTLWSGENEYVSVYLFNEVAKSSIIKVDEGVSQFFWLTLFAGKLK